MRRSIVRAPSTGRRRASALAAVALAASAAAVVADARPASAETRLEVDAGHAGGHFVPGRSIPVRVAITADRLVRGTLTVAVPGASMGVAGEEPLTVPVEVPGGSTKEVVVALPVPAQAGDTVEVAARLHSDGGGGTAAGSDQVTYGADTELVGLLPGVAGALPGATPLAAELGTARFEQLGESELAVPGALGGLGTVVAPAEGLGGVAATARRNVLAWVDAGGRLVVDAAPGAPVDGLPAEWQPGDARQAPAGRGEVALSDGAAAASRWAAVVEPTPIVTRSELPGGDTFVTEPVGDSIARDAGLRVPELGWLLGFLVAYLALAGPVAYVVLRRLGRTGWAWAVVPALAVGFSAVAVVAGDELRSGSTAAHASLVETGPAGSRALVHVGLVSRNGRDGEARFAEGWLASGLRSGVRFDRGSGGAAATEVGPGGRPVARVALEAGGFGLVTGSGPTDGVEGLRVTATAGPGGEVTGTVVNGTDLALTDVIVMVGRRTAAVGELAPGVEREWAIEASDTGPADPWGPPEEPWMGATGWNGSPDRGSRINYSLWSTTLSQAVDPYPPGEAVVAGWTRDWRPPVEVDGELRAGRTAVTARGPVAAEGPAIPASAVRRTVVRGPRTVPSNAQPGDGGEQGPQRGVAMRFVLPPGADPAAPLVVDAPASVGTAEAWDGTAWVPVSLRQVAAGGGGAATGGGAAAEGAGPLDGEAAGGAAGVARPGRAVEGPVQPAQAPQPAPEGGVARVELDVVEPRQAGPAQPAPEPEAPFPADPFNPTIRMTGDLPPAATRDGVVYLRIGALLDGPAPLDVTVRGRA